MRRARGGDILVAHMLTEPHATKLRTTAGEMAAVVIGCSAGGVGALLTLVPVLPERLPAAVLVAQHLDLRDPGLIPTLLRHRARLPVETAKDGAAIRAGVVCVAPPALDLIVSADRTMSLVRPSRSHAIPSVDRLFETAAVVYGNRLVAQRMAAEHVHAIIVLTDYGDRRPYAVVTDRDLLRVADRFDELTAGEIATEEILTARPGEPLAEAAHRMADHDATHAVVIDDRTGRPVGVLSTLDVAGILGWGRA